MFFGLFLLPIFDDAKGPRNLVIRAISFLVDFQILIRGIPLRNFLMLIRGIPDANSWTS